MTKVHALLRLLDHSRGHPRIEYLLSNFKLHLFVPRVLYMLASIAGPYWRVLTQDPH